MKVYFGGDVVPTNQNSNLFISGNTKKLFGKLNEITKDADAYIVNLECCLTDNDAPIIKKGPNIKAPTKSINGIKAAGITHVALANNHSVDHGIENAKEMLNLLTENGIGYVGIGENDNLSRAILYIEKNGVKIGVVNVCEHEYTYALPDRMGCRPYDPYDTIEDIRKALYASKIISYAQGYTLMRTAAKTYGWNLNYGGIALMWRGGCIIRSVFLGKIKDAYDRNPELSNLLLDEYFKSTVEKLVPAWREVAAAAIAYGIPAPTMTSALSYFDGYTTERLPANMLQAQRDYFGAHTYERLDAERGKFFHTNWTGRGGSTSAATYNA